MDLSGEALSLIINFYKIDKKDIFIVYDDIALDLGTVKIQELQALTGVTTE